MFSSVRIFNSLSHLLNKNTSAFKYNYADKILLIIVNIFNHGNQNVYLTIIF